MKCNIDVNGRMVKMGGAGTEHEQVGRCSCRCSPCG